MLFPALSLPSRAVARRCGCAFRRPPCSQPQPVATNVAANMDTPAQRAVLAGIDDFAAGLQSLRALIERGDEAGLRRALGEIAAARRAWGNR